MSGATPLKAVLTSKDRDIGDFSVRRLLPQIGFRSVGPWVFLDHFGPVSFNPGSGMDVRPHPHINLATVTYLFEGEIFHRDSLGYAQAILPGAINLMVAGRGIAHSERTRPELRKRGFDLHGLQLWMALPEQDEETDPAFYHHPSEDIPSAEINGVAIRVLMGSAFGVISPVKTFSPTLYFEADMAAGQVLTMPDVEELAIYVVSGQGEVDGQSITRHGLGIVDMASDRMFRANAPSRIAVIGGAPLGPRHMWWNFISSRPERIEQAKRDWQNGVFGAVPGDEDEYIPLPE